MEGAGRANMHYPFSPLISPYTWWLKVKKPPQINFCWMTKAELRFCELEQA